MKNLWILDLNTGKLTVYNRVEMSPEGAANVILRKAMLNEGFERYHKHSRSEYVTSWVDDLQEVSEEDMDIDTAIEICADRLVFGGDIHIIDHNKEEVDYYFRAETYQKIIDILTESVRQTA
jgi:hypothetical protein